MNNVLSTETKLIDLIEKGATELGDIPLEEIIAYARDTCILVASDGITDDDQYLIGHAGVAAKLQEALQLLKQVQGH